MLVSIKDWLHVFYMQIRNKIHYKCACTQMLSRLLKKKGMERERERERESKIVYYLCNLNWTDHVPPKQKAEESQAHWAPSV